MIRAVALAFVVAMLAWPVVAPATPCAGFDDVDDTSPFCPNVEWLKNRSVTLGCTSSTAYCPTDPVTRLSMAAFMNRLGAALTPDVQFRLQTMTGTAFVGLGYNYGCQTADFTVASPKYAELTGSFYYFSSGGPSVGRLRLAYSTDGGASWTNASIVGAEGALWVGTATADGWDSITGHSNPLALQPGTNYRFGVGLAKVGGAGTIGEYGCRSTLNIYNRNPASSPFDAPTIPASSRAGPSVGVEE